MDAMHDVFVNLLNGAGSLQVDPDAASSLLHRVATNVCLNRLRGERRRPQDPDEALLLEIASLDDLEGRTAAGAVLGRLFGREPESTRTMAVLRGLREKLDALQVNEVAR